MGSYPIKYKYPLFFLVSTKTTNQPKRCSTVSPLSSWTSIKLLSSELVSSPHVCVHTELSSDYFCMENLGTLSPKLTLYWATLKKWFKPHLLEKYLYFGIFLEIILQFYVANILASFNTNWKLIKALSGNAI